MKRITVYAKTFELAEESVKKTHPEYSLVNLRYECYDGVYTEYTATITPTQPSLFPE